MNERIKELMLSKGLHKYIDPDCQARMEMLAELIVKECADLYTHDDVMAPVGQSAWSEAYQDGWIEGTKAYRETILEHFGVE